LENVSCGWQNEKCDSYIVMLPPKVQKGSYNLYQTVWLRTEHSTYMGYTNFVYWLQGCLTSDFLFPSGLSSW